MSNAVHRTSPRKFVSGWCATAVAVEEGRVNSTTEASIYHGFCALESCRCPCHNRKEGLASLDQQMVNSSSGDEVEALSSDPRPNLTQPPGKETKVDETMETPTEEIAPEADAPETFTVEAEKPDGSVDESVPKPKRPRTNLEAEVKRITDASVTGEIGDYFGNEPITPHRIANAIYEKSDRDSKPSTGAVTEVLKRWRDVGFITVTEKPFAFEDYTEQGRTLGLNALKAQAKEARKAAKNAEAAQDSPEANEGVTE